MNTPYRIVIVAVVLPMISCGVEAGYAAEQKSSVAIVSSVNGEAQIAHPNGAQQPDQPKFRGPIIYGDHLSTGKDATLGLFVGQNSLLTMKELSEVRIAESEKNRQILEMAKGKVCIAVSRQTTTSAQPFVLRTPSSFITATAGTLLSVDVETLPQKSQMQDGERGIVVLAAMRALPSSETAAGAVETYQVVEGSVDIVSLAPGGTSTSLRTGQSLRITGGVRGQPFTAPLVNCRAQEVQILPVHTNSPLPLQRLATQQHLQIAAAQSVETTQQPASLAAMAQTAGATPAVGAIPSGVYIPISNIPTNALTPTTPATITITLPNN